VNQIPDRSGPARDAAGFPLCLYRIHERIHARGGAVTGAGHEWHLVPPTPDLATIRIAFEPDGDAIVSVTGQEYIAIDADATLDPYPGHQETELDAAVLAILDGHYQEFTAHTPDGAPAAHGWTLPTSVGTLGTTGYHTPVPTDPDQAAQLQADWNYQRTTYPAWPQRSRAGQSH